MDGVGFASLGMDLNAALGVFPEALLPDPADAAGAARVFLRGAWRALLTLDFDEASARLSEAECRMSKLPVEPAAELRREVTLLHAAALVLQDNGLAALPIAAVILKENTVGRCASIARLLCRFGHWQLGDFAGYCALPHATLSRGRRRGGIAVLEMAMEAAIAFEQLRLGTARRLALDAVAMADGLGDTRFVQPVVVAAQVAYEQGHLDEAESLLGPLIGVIKASGDIESVLRAHILLFRIAARRGQRELALARLKEAEAIGTKRRWPRLVAASVAARVAALIEDDRLDDAEVCLSRVPSGPGFMASHDYVALARARIATARNASIESLGALRSLRETAIARQNLYGALELSLLLVDALARLGRRTEAAQMLLPLLALGYASGLYQTFVDAGPRMGSVLTIAYQQACSCESTAAELLTYIDSLFVRWRPHPWVKRAVAPLRSTASLSSREREIHRLLGLGLSNKCIARELSIHPETVKSHVKRIFSKLEVKTRAEAVSRMEG